jgi:hypothetical protein
MTRPPVAWWGCLSVVTILVLLGAAFWWAGPYAASALVVLLWVLF